MSWRGQLAASKMKDVYSVDEFDNISPCESNEVRKSHDRFLNADVDKSVYM